MRGIFEDGQDSPGLFVQLGVVREREFGKFEDIGAIGLGVSDAVVLLQLLYYIVWEFAG